MGKYLYYVVYPGWRPGIYRDYDRAAAACSGHSGDLGNRAGFNNWERADEHYKMRVEEWTGTRSLPDPKYTEWFQTPVSDIQLDQIQIQDLQLEKLPKVKQTRVGRRERIGYLNAEIDTQFIGRWGEEPAS